MITEFYIAYQKQRNKLINDKAKRRAYVTRGTNNAEIIIIELNYLDC